MPILTENELQDALTDIREVRESQERKAPTPAYDFAAALDALAEWKITSPDAENAQSIDQKLGNQAYTIFFALKLAAKVMQEPSEGMCIFAEARKRNHQNCMYSEIFTAMISQACAEITTQKD